MTNWSRWSMRRSSVELQLRVGDRAVATLRLPWIAVSRTPGAHQGHLAAKDEIKHTHRVSDGLGQPGKKVKNLAVPGTLVALFKDGTADFAIGRVAVVNGQLSVVTDRGSEPFSALADQLVGVSSDRFVDQFDNVVTPELVAAWSVGLKPEHLQPLILSSQA